MDAAYQRFACKMIAVDVLLAGHESKSAAEHAEGRQQDAAAE